MSTVSVSLFCARNESACEMRISAWRSDLCSSDLLASCRPVEFEGQPSLADSRGGGIGLGNRLTFAMVRGLVDDVVLLSEAEIAAAMRRLFRAEGWEIGRASCRERVWQSV